MDIREFIRHIREGRSDRTIARCLNINRKTVARYRTWAEEQGLLEGRLPHALRLTLVFLGVACQSVVISRAPIAENGMIM